MRPPRSRRFARSRKELDMRGFVIAVFFGAGIWLALVALTGRREAWDHALYFVAGLPALCGLAGALAWLEPRRSWLVPIGLAAGQLAAMIVRSPGGMNLWPLTLAALALLGLPQLVVASLAALARRRALDGSRR